MSLSLKTERLKRYKDIAMLLLKYGRSDLVKSSGLQETLAGEAGVSNGNGSGNGDGNGTGAGDLAADLERLGPTFIKLGQILSARPDLLPPAYIQNLSRLQDHIEPFSFDQVEAIVHAELGVRISKAFSEFKAEPIAAASLGQVHRAVLRDGRMVAVKVQRPGVKDQILEDVEIMTEIVTLMEKHSEVARKHGLKDMVTEFRRSLLRELDYREEAQNLTTLHQNLARFKRIVVPRPIDDYTTDRVLTMEYIHGAKVTSLSPLAKLDVDGPRLAEQLFGAYLKQILVDGFFHADPHPGNIFVTDDGKHVALLDLGMVARVSPGMQENLMQLLLAISECNSENVSSIALRIGDTGADFDAREFHQRVKSIVESTQNTTIENLQLGPLMMAITRTCLECGIHLPPELAMLGKTLLNLDEIGRTLDPSFNPNEFIRRHSPELMSARLKKGFSKGAAFSGLLETQDFLRRLPRRVNKILDRVADNDLSIKVHAIDEQRLISGLEKIANRITMGLILAALVVGAAMLMSVPTTFKIFGYPGIAMIFFLSAALGGILLMVNILLYDVKHRESGARRRL